MRIKFQRARKGKSIDEQNEFIFKGKEVILYQPSKSSADKENEKNSCFFRRPY